MGFIALGRFRLSQPIVDGASVLVGPFRGGVPCFIGQTGKVADGDRVVAIAQEIPQPHVRLSKEEREQAHVERFVADFASGTGKPPFDRFERGNGEFPDFVFFEGASSAPKELECTQLVVGERLEASARFESLRRTVLGTNRDRFRHLAGLVVYVDLDAEVTLGRETTPSGATDSAVIAAIERLRPPPPDPPEPPDTFDASRVIPFEGGRVWADHLGPDYVTFFRRRTGFELALSLPTEIMGAGALRLLRERVDDKELRAPHTLLITAGGTTTGGFAFPADTVLAHLAIERGRHDPLHVERITRIWLHAWATQSIYELHPEGFRLVCGEQLRFGETAI